jgi:hypothetical protein
LTRVLGLAIGILILGAVLPGAMASEDTRYVTTNLKGKLSYPETGKPMVGAVLRFTPVDGTPSEATTDANGEFLMTGLTYSVYAVEIETASGENIQGVNALEFPEGETVTVTLKISDRIQSTTKLANEPDRFAAVVTKEKFKGKKFWTQFAAFVGVAILTAILFF